MAWMRVLNYMLRMMVALAVHMLIIFRDLSPVFLLAVIICVFGMASIVMYYILGRTWKKVPILSQDGLVITALILMAVILLQVELKMFMRI